MKRPAGSDFVFGHRLWQAITLSASLLLSAAWATQRQRGESMSWLLPAIAMLFWRATFTARARVLAYREWRAAWDEMAGTAPQARKPGPARPKRSRRTRIILGAAAWVLLTCWLSAHENEAMTPAFQAGALGFAGLTLWGLGAASWGVIRWAFSPHAPAPSRRARGARADRTVAVCPPVPWRSPGPREFTAALPDYCQSLLRRGAAASSP